MTGSPIFGEHRSGSAHARTIVPPDGSPSSQCTRVRIAVNGITAKFGSQVYLWELSSALAKIDGVELTLLVGNEKANDLPPSLLSRTLRLPIPSNRSYSQIFRQKPIREFLLRETINLYLVPNMPVLGETVPTVVTIHDLADLRIKKYGVLRTAYRTIVNLIAARRADHVLTVSESSKRDIVRLLRIPESKVTVVYNGVSKEFKPLDRKECKDFLASKYSITGNYLLAPGGLSRNKNIRGLLAAMRVLKERGASESLVLLGDKDDREFKYIIAELRQSGLDKSVALPGYVPREHLPAFYNAALLVVYPTLYEGFGFPVLEAMSCGTPVVTSNTSSLPEIAGEAALLVDPRNPEEIADAVQKLLADGPLRSVLSSRGLVHAQRFTWEKAAKETLKVFLDLTARKQTK